LNNNKTLASRTKWLATGGFLVMVVAVLATSLLSQTRPTAAAGAPVTQCNGVGGGGGQGYACFVVIDNYL
jgi:hypothetical protein